MFLFQLSGLSKSENLKYFCELVYAITKIPVSFLNGEGSVLFEYNEKQMLNPLYSGRNELYRQLMVQERPDDVPYFTSTNYMETYFIIDVKHQNNHLGSIVAGPAITAEIGIEAVNSLVQELKIELNKKFDLINYYQSLPVTDYKKLIAASILLHYLIYGVKLDTGMIVERNSLIEKINKKVEESVNSDLAKKRQYSLYHITPAYEKYLLQYVKEGDTEKLLDHLNKPAGGEPGVLSKNPLRSQKDLLICSITLISRAAIDGGLSSELALTISDSYIQQVEELNEINEIGALYYKICRDYTERVHELRGHNYSKTVLKCQNYIFKHLYEDITLPILAEIAGVNCNYLSELFKREVGMSVSEYIQKEKIEEAKKLLLLSGESIMDIGTKLNFNDQSYFTKVFKRVTGLTPKQYRKKNYAY